MGCSSVNPEDVTVTMSAYDAGANEDHDKDYNDTQMHAVLLELESLLNKLNELMTENMQNGNYLTKLLCPPGEEENTDDALKKLLLRLNQDEEETYTIRRFLNAYVASKATQNRT